MVIFLQKSYFSRQTIFIIIPTTSYNTSHIFPNVFDLLVVLSEGEKRYKWEIGKNENHPAFHFIECIRDNFLYQHSDSFTRFRDGQDPSCLDLVLTDKEEIIEDRG